ncbi:MAG: allophanate hydrolase, partial [Rhodocyclaceae bacterium]|nr:allophanate hydrolase [Rhodocyclaceae bacterium]
MTEIPAVLSIDFLLDAYRDARLSPAAVMDAVLARIAAQDDQAQWISVLPPETLRRRAAEQDALLREDRHGTLQRLPLLGIPFAVKDNIDVAGLPTTAACPEFAYQPERSADTVARLEAAGALVVGKTNLDQFATGLVGVRSPYGAPRNPFNAHYISGGSSSGSATVTARGLVAFALGTDTAGSGRVPAGFCNLVGVKPTPGLLSNRGVVPACRSLDCVSVFAHTVSDGWRVLGHMVDQPDLYIRPAAPLGTLPRGQVVGVPAGWEADLDPQAARAYRAALDIVAGRPGVRLENVDLAPFLEVAGLLYDGPWVAERRHAVGAFFDRRAAMDPTVARVIARADGQSAVDAYAGQYRLAELRAPCLAAFERVDLLLLPTTPTLYTREQVLAHPVEYNTRLGRYTNFVNLLGLCALAMPGPFREDGLPAGVTLVGPGGGDHRLAELARNWEPHLHRRLGTGTEPPPRRAEPLPPLPSHEATVDVAVVGAHLAGLPLNWQLLERGARLIEATTTAPEYRLYALPGTVPPKPGLIRVDAGGASIAVEVWRMPLRQFGSFVADVGPPLGIGSLSLAGGRVVKGFICESSAVAAAKDITAYGGWRNYIA